MFWTAVSNPPFTIEPFSPAGTSSAENGAIVDTLKSIFVCIYEDVCPFVFLV